MVCALLLRSRQWPNLVRRRSMPDDLFPLDRRHFAGSHLALAGDRYFARSTYSGQYFASRVGPPSFNTELPPRWMGKAHAMWSAAKQSTADWLLFTDADVMFRPDCLRRAIAYAEAERADHLVLFPRTIMKRPGEKMMLAFFQLMFVFGHRPWKV